MSMPLKRCRNGRLQSRVMRDVVRSKEALPSGWCGRVAKQEPVRGPLINDAHANPTHRLVSIVQKSFWIYDQATDWEANTLSSRERSAHKFVRLMVCHHQDLEC